MVMKTLKFLPVIMLIIISALIGFAIQHFTDFSWLAATLMVMVAFLLNGLAIFSEDIDPGGFDYQKGVTDTPGAKKEQKKVMRIQGVIIIVLFTLAILAGFLDI